MNLADMWMVQRRDRAGFLLQAPHAIGICGELRWQHLDRNVSSEARVARAIDLAHAACPEQSPHFIGTDERTRRERQWTKTLAIICGLPQSSTRGQISCRSWFSGDPDDWFLSAGFVRRLR